MASTSTATASPTKTCSEFPLPLSNPPYPPIVTLFALNAYLVIQISIHFNLNRFFLNHGGSRVRQTGGEI